MLIDRLHWIFYPVAEVGPGDGPYLDEQYAHDRATAFGGTVVSVDVDAVQWPQSSGAANVELPSGAPRADG